MSIQEVDTVDVLIIGAGPSGCVAASYIHEQGFKVLVVEKDFFPRFTIGESLLPKCMEHFEEAGLLDVLLKKDFEVKKGARFIRDNQVCEFHFREKYSEGWDWTWQVPRADFDLVLTQALSNKGIEVAFGQEVVDVLFENDGKSITYLKDTHESVKKIHAKYVIDSSGFGRVLPNLLGLNKPSALPAHSSIFTHIKDINRPIGKEGTQITFDILEKEVWLWVIPFSNGITSIGVVGPTSYLEKISGSTTTKLETLLKRSQHFANRFENLPSLFVPKMIKNFAKAVTQKYGKGFVLTGNSAEFLDPVFSSGVTFATESALLASKLITQELNGLTVNWQKDYAEYIDQGVEVFSTYVKEWYTGNLQEIFFQKNGSPEIKRQICAVLAGYVWDKSNPFVKKHDRLIKSLAHVIKMNQTKNS